MEMDWVHFVGIGGYGMGPLAKIMHDKGSRVTGSDIKVSERTERMAGLGAKVTIGHSADNVEDGVSMVVVSAAVPQDNPEVVKAKSLGVPVLTHAQMVGWLLDRCTGIAVAGAHGKTTTTAMVATVLDKAGLSPTVLVGGEVDEFSGGGKLGSGEYFVVEADEAYGRFLEMRPKIAAVTNIDDDHLDYYRAFDNIKAAFEAFIGGLPDEGLAILNADEPLVRKLAEVAKCRVLTYGRKGGDSVGCDLRATDVVLSEFGSEFTVTLRQDRLGSIKLNIPGEHNVSNSLVAVAVGLELKVPFADIAKALGGFRGVHRRFELHGTPGDVMVVDDYAHHPTEIKAVLEAAKAGWTRRLIAVFQPQRFSRTQYLMEDFSKAFDDADIVVLTDIYYEGTGEQPIPGVDSAKVLELLRAHWSRIGKEATAIHIADLGDVVRYLRSICRSGDLVITMGAGNISQVAKALNADLA